ncbi:hypothetical protein ABID25_005821 [Mesorhizobium abyssinicae]
MAPEGTLASFFRTAAGAEIDLVLQLPANRGVWAVEIKRSPSLGTGLHMALEDVRPDRTFVVYAGTESYPLAPKIQTVGLIELASLLSEQS